MSPLIGKWEMLCHIVVHFTVIVTLTVPFTHLVHVDDFHITKPVTLAEAKDITFIERQIVHGNLKTDMIESKQQH